MNATTRRYDGRGTKLTCSGHGYGVKGERASVRACLLACFVSVEAAKLPARKILTEARMRLVGPFESIDTQVRGVR